MPKKNTKEATPVPETEATGRTRRTLDPDAKINKLVKETTLREGSRGHTSWGHIKSGMKVSSAVDAGALKSCIWNFLTHGWIELVPPESKG